MEKFGLKNKLEMGVTREPIYGDITLDIESKTLASTESGATEKLTDKEYQVLRLLVRAQGGLVSSGEFISFLYEDIPEEQDLPIADPLGVYLHRVRKKIAIVSQKINIENVQGLGWRLVSS